MFSNLSLFWRNRYKLQFRKLSIYNLSFIHFKYHPKYACAILQEPSSVIAHLRFQWLISQLTKILWINLNHPQIHWSIICMVFIRIPLQFLTFQWKQTNPRFLTNVATSGDIAHAYFGWFLKWIKERFYFESFRNWSLYLFLQNKLKFENI
jgi:hypothetical protein